MERETIVYSIVIVMESAIILVIAWARYHSRERSYRLQCIRADVAYKGRMAAKDAPPPVK